MRRGEKGAALVVVLMVLAVMTILGTAALGMSAADTRFAVNEENRLRAYYIARSGAEAVAKVIDTDAAAASKGSASGSYGGGSYTVSITKPEPDIVKLLSTGTYDNVSRTVTLTMRKASFFGGNALTVLSSLNIHNPSNCDVNGGNVLVAPGAYLNPSATSPAWSNNIIQPGYSLRVGPVPPSSVGESPDNPYSPVSDFKIIDKNASESNPGNITDGSSFNGYSFDSIEIRNNEKAVMNISGTVQIKIEEFTIRNLFKVTGNGILYINTGKLLVDGNIIAGSGVKIEFDVYDTSSSNPEVEIRTGCSVLNAYIFAPEADVSINANGVVAGGIVANTVHMSSGADINYDSTHAPPPPPGYFAGYDKVKWGNE